MEKKAVIIVDYQNDFADKEKGALYVNGGETIYGAINDISSDVKSNGGIIIATKDMHRVGNISFAKNFKGKFPITESIKNGQEPGPQNFITLKEVESWNENNNGLELSAGFTIKELKAYLSTLENQTMALWPNHCVVDTPGSDYQKNLDTSLIDIQIAKGYRNSEHPYSAFPGIEIGTKRDMLEVLNQENIKEVDVVGLATDWCVKDTCMDIVKTGGYIVRLILKATKAVSPENEIEYLGKMREAGITIVEG